LHYTVLWYHHTETSEWSKITKIQFCKYEQIVVKFMYEIFGCDYCVLLTVNMLCHVEVTIWLITMIILRCTVSKMSQFRLKGVLCKFE